MTAWVQPRPQTDEQRMLKISFYHRKRNCIIFNVYKHINILLSFLYTHNYSVLKEWEKNTNKKIQRKHAVCFLKQP